MFMAAFVLSVYVYVYLRIRGPPGAGKKKAINRKEEYEEKEEYEAILGAGNEAKIFVSCPLDGLVDKHKQARLAIHRKKKGEPPTPDWCP